LLSLDAPLIALLWQDLLSRCYPTVLHAAGRVVLGLTVWAIYVADRLLDIRHVPPARESIKHRFYRAHRVFARTLLLLVVGVDLAITSLWLRPAVLDNGLVLTGGVVVYLGAFPFTGWSATAWKKPLAALLFTAGIFLVEWTGASHPLSRLVWPAAAFWVLCLGNLLTIERWNREPASIGWSRRMWILLPVAAACLAGGWSSRWFGAIAAGAAGLCILWRWGRAISGDARCVLADVALLTPLLFR
jgi:hypothetical protein